MSKKSGGLGALLFGAAMGAAALFLSKKENRDKTKKVIATATVKAKKLKEEYKKNPAKVKKELKAEGKKLAVKALSAAKKVSKQIKSKAVAKTKKSSKK